MRRTVYICTLERAAEIFGGERGLASYLGVSRARVRLWMQGHDLVPQDVFLKLVDLLLERGLAQLHRDVDSIRRRDV